MLRQDEAAGQVLGLLMGLDAIRVLLPVEPMPVQAPAPEGDLGGTHGMHSCLQCFAPCMHAGLSGTFVIAVNLVQGGVGSSE